MDVPDVMVNEELDRMIKDHSNHLKMQGISLEQFYQFTNSDESALKDQMREEAHKRIVYRLMLEEIVKVEKLEVSTEDAEKEAETLAEKYQMTKQEFLDAFGGLDMIQYDLEMRKTIDRLKELNK